MKLELKHLAGYLEHGLQVVVNENEVHMLMGLSLEYDQNPMWIQTWNNIESTEGEAEIRNVFPEGCKPILHPLSDLTKEIEIGGEKFVPLRELNLLDDEYKIMIEDDGCLCFSDNCNLNLFELMRLNKIISKLHEWHFDIHGLIDEGLAIDINTL